MLRAMNLREQLLSVADIYGGAVGIGRKRLSTIVLNRGSRLDDIANGGDLGTSIFEAAMLWFSENWPVDAAWPADVPRPVVSVLPAVTGATAAEARP